MRIPARNRAAMSTLAALILLLQGCTGKGTDPANKEGTEVESSVTATQSGHNYQGRDWCQEHGVPESNCALCDSDVATAFKESGDWCDKHDRPDSQCFICHPDLKDKFAAKYKAKYGEDPPAMSEEDHDHDDDGEDEHEDS